jgi:hypothetical protein
VAEWGRKPTPEELTYWMCNAEEIDKRVEGTELAAMIDRHAAAQRSGVLGSLNMVADAFKLLPKESETKQRWSTVEWAKERKGWVASAPHCAISDSACTRKRPSSVTTSKNAFQNSSGSLRRMVIKFSATARFFIVGSFATKALTCIWAMNLSWVSLGFPRVVRVVLVRWCCYSNCSRVDMGEPLGLAGGAIAEAVRY